MRKTLLVSILVSFVLLSLVSAQPSTQINYTASSNSNGIVITQLNYQPAPANPGEYFDLWIQAQNIGGNTAPDATFILAPTFPFSLDPDQSAVRSFSLLGSTPVLLHYKVKVDPNAVEGINPLKIDYNSDGSGTYLEKTFDIQVTNAQTNFDLVIQGSSSTATSIGIANTGENQANSLIVKIPEQSGFRVSGTNGQIVGNLNSGDYTIATFDLIPIARSNNNTLQVELDYTDLIGVRRTVIENVPYTSTSSGSYQNLSSGSFPAGASGFRRPSQSSIFTNAWFWIVISVVIVGAGVFVLMKFKKKKQQKKDFDHSKKILDSIKTKDHEKKDSKEPDWVVSERAKKR